jgi:AraC-like DNA-binding protein
MNPYVTFAMMRGLTHREAYQKMLDGKINLLNNNVWISVTEFQNTVDMIQARLADDMLGIHIGQHLDFNTLGVIHSISLKSKTIEEGIHYCHSYLQKTFPILTIRNTIHQDSFSIDIQAKSLRPSANRIVIETTLTVMTRELKLMWGKDSDIVTFSPFADARYPSGWKKGKLFWVTGKVKMLKKPVRDYTSLGLDLLIPEYLKVLELMKSDPSLKSRVKVAILSLAKPVLPALEAVAGQFGCNVRTFQRQLEKEGVSYRGLLNELKMDLSGLLLRHQQFSIADIATILGYSEPAAFTRTFNKWHGNSPLQFRKGMLV